MPRLFACAAVALLIAAHPAADAQFATNAQRDAYIAALVAKVNSQTLWIRRADEVIRDLRCALDAAVDALAAMAKASAAGQACTIDVTVHESKCGSPGTPSPTLGAVP